MYLQYRHKYRFSLWKKKHVISENNSLFSVHYRSDTLQGSIAYRRTISKHENASHVELSSIMPLNFLSQLCANGEQCVFISFLFLVVIISFRPKLYSCTSVERKTRFESNNNSHWKAAEGDRMRRERDWERKIDVISFKLRATMRGHLISVNMKNYHFPNVIRDLINLRECKNKKKWKYEQWGINNRFFFNWKNSMYL